MKNIFILTLLLVISLFNGCDSSTDKNSDTESTNKQVVSADKFLKVMSNSTNFPPNSKIVLNFFKRVKSATVTEESVYILDVNDNPVLAELFVDNETIEITPKYFLESRSSFKVVISKDVELIGYYSMANDFVWGFSTSENRDNSAPKIVKTSVENGDFITQNTIFTALFSEQIDFNSEDNISIELYNVTEDRNVSGVMKLIGNAIRFKPDYIDLNSSYVAKFDFTLIDMSQNSVTDSKKFEFSSYEHSKKIEKSSTKLSGGTIYGIESDLNSSTIFVADYSYGVIEYDIDGKEINSLKIPKVRDLALSEKYIYTVDGDFKVTKISRDNFLKIKDVQLNSEAFDIKIEDERVYVANTTDGLLVFDLDLKPIEAIDEFGSIYGVGANEKDLYLLSDLGEVTILNIDTLQEFSSIILRGESRSIEFGKDFIFIANGYGGVEIVDKTLNRPIQALKSAGFTTDVKKVGNMLFSADNSGGVRVFEILTNENSDRDEFIFKGYFEEDIFEIEIVGDKLIGSAKSGGLKMFDLSDFNITEQL